MFSEGGILFSANDMASFESDAMPSGSILSEDGLIPYEDAILAEGVNIFSEWYQTFRGCRGRCFSKYVCLGGICFGVCIIHLMGGMALLVGRHNAVTRGITFEGRMIPYEDGN